MNQDGKWRVIADQRRVLADLLDGLAAPDWDRPSLCSEWRIRDVAAHVALTPRAPGVGAMLVKAIRARGDFDGLTGIWRANTPTVRPP